MEIHLEGIPEFEAALTAHVNTLRAATKRGVASAAHLLESETKRRLSKYSHPRHTPTPSPPGEPPAIVTGQLRRSIKVEDVQESAPDTFTARVGPTAAYGRIQELGGQLWNGGELPARPYLGPSVRHLKDTGQLLSEFRAAWTAALVRSVGGGS